MSNINLTNISKWEIPAEITSLMLGISWEQRLSKLVEKEGTYTLHFFSDGLNLTSKLAVEKFAALQWNKSFPEHKLTVLMERKEKTPQPATPQASQHSHKELATNPKPFSKKNISGVKRIIAVASGKGGVGKSTVSTNLAMALQNQGYSVGLLDADIYGPSIPLMMGIKEDPKVNSENKIIPPESFGIKVMSFGFFAPEESAVIWRGPMVMKALQQFFYDVAWGELDFLVIDLPPGTGDAQLTLVQSLPICGAVIVTTPQNVALLDAVKGIVMFQKTEVPILGVVENMSYFTCTSCGAENHIFGSGGADKVSEKFKIPVLGHIPLVAELRQAGDSGVPLTTVSGHPMRMRFADIAEKVVKRAIEIGAKP
jgi:ATP-binding protein involved in chromosome partitioning